MTSPPNFVPSPPLAELGMYPMIGVRWAWDTLWGAVAEQLPWLPPKLAHSGDVHAAWEDPNVIVTQICGWPFAAYHTDTWSPVGAFALALPDQPDNPPGYYRSIIVSNDKRSLAELIDAAAPAVINSEDSLSGAHSLAAVGGSAGRWPGPVIETGSHLDSLRAIADGRAEIASIDAWTWTLIRREDPELVEGVHPIAIGPEIPTPIVTARRSLGAELIAQVAAAFAVAANSDETAEARRALCIDGWVNHDLAVYQATLTLGRSGDEADQLT